MNRHPINKNEGYLMKQLITALSLALLSGAAFSQAPAPAGKSNEAMPKPAASAPEQQPGMGMGPGGGGRHGPMMRFNQKNTPGWSLMTEQERTAHRNKMHEMKTVAECNDYHGQHIKQMELRAKEQGKTFKPSRRGPCDMMQQRGMLK
jgi:hypothetical protein